MVGEIVILNCCLNVIFKFDIEWIKNGRFLIESWYVWIEFDGELCFFVILGVRIEDRGEY